MVRRVATRGVPSILFFVQVLSGTYHEMGFRGCAAFFFRAEAAATSRVGVEGDLKGTKNEFRIQVSAMRADGGG